MSKNYTVSYDQSRKMWYVHRENHPSIPVYGTFCEDEEDAQEYANLYNGLPNRVEEIEERRLEELEKELKFA